jgi:hypothetical protein
MTELTTTGATALATSWELALRAERKSPQTIKLYSDGLQRYLAWCSERDDDPMSRTSLNLWVAGLLDAGAAPVTARVRQLTVRRFASIIVETRRSSGSCSRPLSEPARSSHLRPATSI